MERIAEIHQATLSPTKGEVLTQVFGPHEMFGSFRFVDPRGLVGIETLLVHQGGPLLQLPVTYRDSRITDEHEIGTLEHSVLGKRYITRVVADPAAVKEYLRVIVVGDTHAQRSDGQLPPLAIKGTGTEAEVDLHNIHLDGITQESVVGNIDFNGERRRFHLHLPTEVTVREVGLGLTGTNETTGEVYVLAELTI